MQNPSSISSARWPRKAAGNSSSRRYSLRRSPRSHATMPDRPWNILLFVIDSLREAGYASVRVGFGGDFFRGFDKVLKYDEGWYAWEDRPARKAENLNEIAIPALEELVQSGQPWLLFMRHMDPHAPYLPPSPYD